MSLRACSRFASAMDDLAGDIAVAIDAGADPDAAIIEAARENEYVRDPDLAPIAVHESAFGREDLLGTFDHVAAYEAVMVEAAVRLGAEVRT